jgi:hypothetical protein
MTRYSISRTNDPLNPVTTVRRNDRPGLALRMDGADGARAWQIFLNVSQAQGDTHKALADLWTWAVNVVGPTPSQ